jgi:hypothetical protein
MDAPRKLEWEIRKNEVVPLVSSLVNVTGFNGMCFRRDKHTVNDMNVNVWQWNPAESLSL